MNMNNILLIALGVWCFCSLANAQDITKFQVHFTFTEGAVLFKGLWRFYYGAADECIGLAEIDDIGTLLKAAP